MSGGWLKKAMNKLEGASSGHGSSGGGSQVAFQSQPQSSMPSQQAGPASKVHIAYFTNWSIYGRKYRPDKVPVQSLTHLLYAFADVREDGTVFLTDSWSDVEIHYEDDSWEEEGRNLYGNLKQFVRMKQRHRHLKLLLSIGGWTYSPHFAAMQTPQGRTTFVRSAMKILEDVGLDGLDIDWEYPKDAAEAHQYCQLLAELRQALDARSHAVQARHWLSIAAPCGEQMHTLHVGEMDRYLDMWNLMAYDFSGTWSSKAAHQANLFDVPSSDASVERAVNHYLAKGVAPHKLVLGMPLYARAFANTKGLGKSFQGVPEGGAEPGNFFYNDVPLAGHEEHFDEHACATYSICQTKGEFASYEGPASTDAKCEYVHRRGLGGVMWWELSGDADSFPERRLIPRAAHRLGSLDSTPNNLHFPYSQYDNLRSGQSL